ncbi:MAG: 16S rRNA (guanine(966)-N(2))-methyltransferase RsmD [Chthoniobacteraceae bacterium]
MRVVGGIAGGIQLHVPKTDLRPTMDVVKNAIFSSLAEFVPGTRVLDLFAGTGGLGIEALSRGATSCVFVESDRRACDSIRRNLEKTKLTGGQIVCADALRWVGRNAQPAAFDLILADPPYAGGKTECDFARELIVLPELIRALAPDGIFVLEHRPEEPLPLGAEWECTRDKRYGATAVAFLRAAHTSPSND